MTKKKSILFVSLGIIMFMICVSVKALDQHDKVGSTTVSYRVGEVYIVTIPEDIYISTKPYDYKITASEIYIPEGSTLEVTMQTANYDGGYRLSTGKSKIPYTIKINDKVQNSEIIKVLSAKSDETEKTKSATMTIQTTDENIHKATVSGVHTDTLTFTCSVVY